jgi:hypothetical protein
VTLFDLWVYVRDGGTLVVLFLIIVGGWKQYWHFGWYADEQRKRITKLEGQLDRAVGAAESGTGLATRAIRQAEGRQGEHPDQRG